MFLLLTIIYALRRAFAAPILDTSIIDERSPPSCTDLGNCRTIWNIIWSCLVTVFACTWVAVHPNVPMSKPGQKSNSHWYSRPLRKARIMLYGVIAPEFVIFWAWRQRCAASRKPRDPTILPGMCLDRCDLGHITQRSSTSCRLVPRSWFLCSHGRLCLS